MNTKTRFGLAVGLGAALFISPVLFAQEMTDEEFLKLFDSVDEWAGTWTRVKESSDYKRVQSITIERRKELGGHWSLVGKYTVTVSRPGQRPQTPTSLVCTGTPPDQNSPRTLVLKEDLGWHAINYEGGIPKPCVTLKIIGSRCYMDNHHVPCPARSP